MEFETAEPSDGTAARVSDALRSLATKRSAADKPLRFGSRRFCVAPEVRDAHAAYHFSVSQTGRLGSPADRGQENNGKEKKNQRHKSADADSFVTDDEATFSVPRGRSVVSQSAVSHGHCNEAGKRETGPKTSPPHVDAPIHGVRVRDRTTGSKHDAHSQHELSWSCAKRRQQ